MARTKNRVVGHWVNTCYLHPTLESAANIQNEDPLANYYFDWSNLSSTNETDVEALLNSF